MGKGASEVIAARSQAVERRARRLSIRLSFVGLGGVLVVGCVYDADDRCSPGQVVLSDGLCVCAPGSVLTADGCVDCAENEVAAGSACVCADGFARPAEGAACEATLSGPGTVCDVLSAFTLGEQPASRLCSDPAFPVCHSTDGAMGYCTSECTTSEDCEGGYACDTMAEAPYCRRPPTGAGRTCATAADCAGADASFCESFMLRQCVVAGCTPDADDCFEGTQCCDFTMLGAPAPFCLPDGAC